MPVFKPMAPYPWDADPALAAAPGSPAATSQTRPCTTLLEARSHAHIHTPARACARGGATPPSGAAASQKQSTYKKRVGAEQSRAPTSFVYTLQPCQGVMCRLHTHTHTHLTDRPRFSTPLSDTPPPSGFHRTPGVRANLLPFTRLSPRTAACLNPQLLAATRSAAHTLGGPLAAGERAAAARAPGPTVQPTDLAATDPTGPLSRLSPVVFPPSGTSPLWEHTQARFRR